MLPYIMFENYGVKTNNFMLFSMLSISELLCKLQIHCHVSDFFNSFFGIFKIFFIYRISLLQTLNVGGIHR